MYVYVILQILETELFTIIHVDKYMNEVYGLVYIRLCI